MGGRLEEEKAMKCIMCKQGETEPGTTTMTLERDTTTVVFKNVPAEVCQTCDEAYLDAETTRHLLHIVEEAVRAGVQLQVRSYAA
jgi:YgiT-type zinc finger domain-containing protein